MAKRLLLSVPLVIALASVAGRATAAQDDSTNIRVNVDLVQLNVAVTDSKGNYVSGLGPENFAITEDRIPERIATFEEGNEPARQVSALPPGGKPAAANAATPAKAIEAVAKVNQPAPAAGAPSAGHPAAMGEDLSTMPGQVAGANVFVLFDTSNYMYRGFVFAQDAITDFVRSLQSANKVAFYSYSRDLSRNSVLTSDRQQVLRGVRSTVAGDDAALYNCLLLTVEDAARYTGRKVVVVFSNGPDNASLVPPEDVAELAQSTGTIIYMISTREAQLEPISTAVFERMSKATGGKAYFAPAVGVTRRKRSPSSRMTWPTFTHSVTTRSTIPARAGAPLLSNWWAKICRSTTYAPGRVTGCSRLMRRPTTQPSLILTRFRSKGKRPRSKTCPIFLLAPRGFLFSDSTRRGYQLHSLCR